MTYVPIPLNRRPQPHVPDLPLRPLRSLMKPAEPKPPAEEPTPQPSPTHAHRVERFLHLGFTETDAQLMALARGSDGYLVYWLDVDRMLEAGCSHAQALAIYA